MRHRPDAGSKAATGVDTAAAVPRVPLLAAVLDTAAGGSAREAALRGSGAPAGMV